MNQTMGNIAAATLAARNGGKAWRNGNYEVRPISGRVETIYHGTTVAYFRNNAVRLDSGGWHTPTTKNVMNAALSGTPYSVRQKNFAWFVDGNGETQDFEDGMELSLKPKHECRNYRIVRMYRVSGRHKTIRRGQTLAMAQAHCSRDDTRKAGVWFDGYEHDCPDEA